MDNLNLENTQAIVDLFVGALKDKLAFDDTNATHQLSNSIKGIVKQNGKWVEVSLNLEDYYEYVEYGRRKGKYPPINAIKRWISVKPVIPYTKNGITPTTNQLAFLISRSIAKKGIKPKPFIEPTKRDFDLVNKIYAALSNAVENEINNVISEELGV